MKIVIEHLTVIAWKLGSKNSRNERAIATLSRAGHSPVFDCLRRPGTRPLTLLVLLLLPASLLGSPEIKKSDVVSMYQADRATYEAYGIDVLAWGGTPTAKSLAAATGIRYFGSVGMVTEFARYYQRFPNSYEDGLCRDVEGNPIKVPWLTDHQHEGIPFWWCCTNQPQFRTFIRERVIETIKAGADGQHIDDHLGTAGSVSHGGCFCERCLTGFRGFLNTLPEASLERAGIRDPESFDYRQIILDWRSRQPAGQVEAWRQPFYDIWMAYHLRAAAGFMMELRRLAAETAGRPVPLSANNCILYHPHTCDFQALDFFSAEIDQEAHRQVLSELPIFAYRLAEGLGRPLAATASGGDWALIKETSFHQLVQRWIALAYASGQSLMTPHRQWCYTKEKGTHWYDGPEEQFAPLYRFVKSHANLFDDFETFADATLVFSQTAYRNGDALKQAGRGLTAAGFSYNLAVAGDETLSHPLDPQQLRQSNRILVLDPATLQPKDRDHLQERCADPQVTCYPSASDLVSSVRPAVDTGTSTDYILLPRKSGDQVVVHLVDRDPRQANRESDLFVDAGAFGWKQIGTATLFQPGQPEITLPVQSNAVRVPSIPIWGILTLSESREGVVGNLQSGPSERARDLGVPFEGVPGPLNAITDVEGVEVGHSTIISGAGALETGKGPIRTGVTTVLPRGKSSTSLVFAGWFSLNGNGEMTGTSWVEESGLLEGPVMITNTHSVGVVRDAVIRWRVQQGGPDSEGYWWSLPVVAETWDGYLNDINGFHVHPEHVFEAIENANSGPVEEGNVGGGTGMVCHEFKGGIGTSSRVVSSGSDRYTVGVLVQANYGLRDQLRIAGVPVGLELREARVYSEEQGSIIIVIATDAPLLSHQLKRLARRATLGLARVGSTSGNGSGDIFIAFSTANPSVAENREKTAVEMLSNDSLSPIFDAVVQATEESIVNALVAAETMVGRDDHRVIELPHDQLRTVLKKYGRLNETTR